MFARVVDRLPAVPAYPVGWGPGDAVLVLLGTQLFELVWASAVILSASSPTDGSDRLPMLVAFIANIGLWLGYGFGPAFVAQARGRSPLADYGVAGRARDLPIGVVLGVFTQLAVLPVLYWPILRLVDADPGAAARDLVEGLDGPFEWFLLTVSAVVVAPLVEEYMFRGLMLRAFQHRFGPVVAVVAQAALFALVHMQPIGFPGLFVFGLVAGAVTLTTGRLATAWALHVAFNATTLLVLGLGS